MKSLNEIRSQFPILSGTMRGKPLVYLDSGATTQKPSCVIAAMDRYYKEENANVHRGVYELSEKATLSYEAVRDKVKAFVNAPDRESVIFTRGTTEAINCVAFSFGEAFVKAGDEIIISEMEHHSNIVPWQMLCERKSAKLNVIPVCDDGALDLAAYKELLSDRVKLVAVSHISNVLGTINPVEEIIAMAHACNIPVLLDGAQAVAHQRVDVSALDCDFYVFSSHKMFGPTGVGVLYGKTHWLNQMPPYQGGGDMIAKVTFEKTEYNVLPMKFEAGTPSIAQVIGLGAAIDFISSIDFDWLHAHEQALLEKATAVISALPGVQILGNTKQKAAVISFVLADAHAHDVASILDDCGVAVRAGHHCAMPLMQRYQVPATVRVSFSLYNTLEEIDVLARGLTRVSDLFREVTL